MKKSRSFIILQICFFLYAPLLFSQQRPNILILIADDMGFSDIGAFGSEIATPRLDQLAKNGLRYTQFYNAARCAPTRASLLTGLYPHQTGIGNMMNDQGHPAYRGDLNQRSVTIAEVLQAHGYSTFMSGKWHVTKQTDQFRDWIPAGERKYTSQHNWPLQRGFEKFFGSIHGAGSYFNPSTLCLGNEPIAAGPDFYYTDAISDYAVKCIAESANERPFFGYVAYTAPHWPLHALPEDIARYKGKYDKGWDAIRQERLARQHQAGIIDESWLLSTRDSKVPAWEAAENKAWLAHCMEVYAAQVDRMDQGIGRIIDQLEKQGQLKNTIIFFLSDNGGCAELLSEKWPRSLHIPLETASGQPVQKGNNPDIMPGPEFTYQSYGVGWANASNTPFRLFKHYIHEGGISTPLIVHWPKHLKRKSQVRTQVAHVKDLMATCLELGRAAYPRTFKGQTILPHEGISLVPSFRKNVNLINDLYWEHHGNRGMRSGDWKLVAEQKQVWELYNLASDRIEMRNLAGEKPDILASMIEKYQQWARRVGVVENIKKGKQGKKGKKKPAGK